MVMGGMAIVRPALNVLGFNSGNVSLSTMSSFSPFSWTCLQREERKKHRLQCITGRFKICICNSDGAVNEVFHLINKRQQIWMVSCTFSFKGYDSVDCTLGGAVVTKLLS